MAVFRYFLVLGGDIVEGISKNCFGVTGVSYGPKVNASELDF